MQATAIRISARVIAAAALMGAVSLARAETLDERLETLLGKMTLEEKAGQLNLVSLEPGFDPESVRRGEVGAVINFSNQHLASTIDSYARSSRLGIPLLVGLDIVHGYRTVLPLPIGMAASFDPGLVRRATAAAARESLAVGVNWSFAPMADVARDLRWGRVVEGLGEDPWLTGQFAAAQVEGFRDGGVASTLKHFAGYSAVYGGRDYDVTWVPPTELYDTHLPPFRDGIRAGADAVMTALTALNGLPTTADGHLMTQILRRELGFKGVAIADWEAVASLVKHGVAKDGAEATRKAFSAGVDMDMTSGLFVKHLPEEVRAGRISQASLDASVRRVLRLKFGLGLFDRPLLDPATAEGKLLTRETRTVAREAARASLVLLKNRGDLLPIDPTKVKRIALVGPFAESKWDQVGPHEGNGQVDDVISIRAGLAERAEKAGITLDFAPGCDRICADRSDFPKAVEAAKAADLVIAVVGEGRDQSGEGSSRAYLGMRGVQQDLIREVAATGKPLVMLVFGGRPVELHEAIDRAQAALMVWIPGTEGGPAVAETLFGDAAPSGKLPVSWPRTVGQLPMSYDRRAGGRPHIDGARWTLGYTDETISPLFPFGYGLTYTHFAYGEPEVLTPKVGVGDRHEASLEVRTTVTNTGMRAGRTVAQLYLSQPVASRSRPLRLLKGAVPLTLAPGETGVARFRIPSRDLGYHEADGTLVVEAGDYRVFVGEDSDAAKGADFAVETGWRGPPGNVEASSR
ncbi:glycoside hydrolase family 3 N-terminal domain-containing protein [Methylobacterium gnaphalii]|uniref:beta-glucosidase n=2 Tax=Methylobacterium gnaphalii TaxID=1010610 RepID=A0A512JLG7_9HYPH|nr:glycoside hydrolase family 3 N-terminal domain-containing protein [Methylobacterium gnaphalii]GEP10796.1 beta-glucosidase [Methylobacterium gnaphalii]GLS49335.1 beta-glucosidase [Methylobacterium gnaphalii]